MDNKSCVILTGMPGAGKSTIGNKLAANLKMPFLDSDKIIESIYGRRLEEVTRALGTEKFRDAECQIICALNLPGCVIATGGSVVYRSQAMDYLKSIGEIVYLKLPLVQVEERVARNPERGISFGPGQTLTDLYEERKALYEKYADIECDTSAMNAGECASFIAKRLANQK